MKVTIIPTVREAYKNRFEVLIDKNLIKFLNLFLAKKLKLQFTMAI